MKKPVTWILVADGARARILRREGSGPGLAIAREPVAEFEGNTAPSREIGADRPGRTFDSAGIGRHAMQPPSDPHELEETKFLRRLAAYLDQANTEHAFDRLVLVAPPKALGTLRAALSKQLATKVTGELNKDLTQVPVHELGKPLGGVMGV